VVVKKAPLLVIAGPTGVGKTAVAVALAARVPLEVVSADSRQVYRSMDIATAKPTRAEREAVRHHLIDVVDPDDRYQAARFRQDAQAIIGDIHRRGRVAAVVGGTGLYIRALLRGLDPAPPADPDFRRELTAVATREWRTALHTRLAATAPALARRLHPHDHVRIIRALEKLRAAPAAHETRDASWSRPGAEYETVYVGLTMARDELATRLRGRAAAMVSAGLAEEVEGLLRRGYDADLPAMHGIGYREFVRVVRGELGHAEALALMQRDTIRYARRQLTWFKREPSIEWLEVATTQDPNDIAQHIESRLGRAELGRAEQRRSDACESGATQ
jgi:tRNA dimethylallyltransferase